LFYPPALLDGGTQDDGQPGGPSRRQRLQLLSDVAQDGWLVNGHAKKGRPGFTQMLRRFAAVVGMARGKEGSARIEVPKSQEETRQQLLAFFADRMKVALRDKGVRHDLISAVFALGGEDDLVRLLDRVAALEGFLDSDDGANLLVAYRRAANIVRIESKKDKRAYDGDADAGRFRQDEETALFGALGSTAEAAGDALAKEDFTGAMSAMAGFWILRFGMFVPLVLPNLRPSTARHMAASVRRVPAMAMVFAAEMVMFPVAVLMFVRATDLGPVALVSTVFGTIPVWVLIFSTALSTPKWNVLNEPLDRETIALKAIAIALIVGGVAGIALL